MPTHTVAKYRLIVRSGPQLGYQEDVITLYDSGGSIVGNLVFSDHETPGLATKGGYTQVTYPRSVYLHAVDMLRNEEPIRFVESGNLEAGIRTGSGEVAGEAE